MLESLVERTPRALARDPLAYLPETAHEFVHTWNLVRLRPAERRGVDWRPAPPSPALWWSEGATMFYADIVGAATPVTTGIRPFTWRVTSGIRRMRSSSESVKNSEAITG